MTPNLEPLRSVPQGLRGDMADWTWRTTLARGARRIERYQHNRSGRFLNLDECGRPWRVWFEFTADVPSVEPVDLRAAIRAALLP